MSVTPVAPGRRSWLVALSLSLLLHASGVVLLLALDSSSGGTPGLATPDTPTPADVMEVRILLYDPPRRPRAARLEMPLPKPASTPRVFPQPAAQRPTPPAAPSPSTVTVRQVGSLEDAEFDGAPAVDSPPERPVSHGEGPGTTSFFQIGTSGKAIVYVIDHSASMGQNNALAAAKAELARSLCRLPASARFQVIAYNRTAQPLRINGRIDLVPATEANKHEAALLLDLLSAEGGTEHLPALRQALALRPEVIFFLTDAADLEPRQVRELTLRNQGGSVIHAIELNRASCRRKGSVLQALAKDNGGVYRVIALGPRAMN